MKIGQLLLSKIMRYTISVIFIAVIALLGLCVADSRRSKRAIAPYVSLLVGGLIMPITGNLLVTFTGNPYVASFGYYLYFIGMDLIMFALFRFTFKYCYLSWPRVAVKYILRSILIIDVVQVLCNMIFHHAFLLDPMIIDGYTYYSFIPLAGQTFHRIVCYSIYLICVFIFVKNLIKAPHIYRERYYVILISMLIGGAWQTYYIFSGIPVDLSMIGFAIFGFLVYYFSIRYRSLRLLDRMLSEQASRMNQALFFFDINGTCIWANDMGQQFATINGDYEKVYDTLLNIFGTFSVKGEWSDKRKIEIDGETRFYSLISHDIFGPNGRKVGSLLSIKDDTQNQLEIQKKIYAANHDSLTGLYSRDYVYERVGETLKANPDKDYFVAYTDIKDFKIVNDIYGSQFGDKVLQNIANTIKMGCPDGSIYGRIGGDNFGMLIPMAGFDFDVMEQNLSNYVVNEDGFKHKILLHIGIYKPDKDEREVSVMFDRAHLALSTIKGEYGTHIVFYDAEMRKRVLWNQHITMGLQDAMANGELEPYYQAMVDKNGRIVGAEVLARWNHPEDGQLSPAAFIPILEKNGMISDVDRFMWRSACATLDRWTKAGRDLFVSINISPMDFYYMDVAGEIKGIVKEYSVDPRKLRLEITETVMMTDIERRMEILDDLKRSGFMIEMDDFGSGYSSLNMLKDMPVDVLKIDMVFLKRHNATKAKTIVKNIIKMSDDLRISSLTEGVETKNQYEILSSMGCNLFQGFYFAKPLPLEEFEALCDKQNYETLSDRTAG